MMKRILTSMLTVLLLAVSPAVAAEPDLPPITTDGARETALVLDPFFSALQRSDATAAYADLFAGTLAESKVIEISQLTAQTNVLLQTYGPITSWELIRSECAVPRLCKLVYMLDTSKGPLYFWGYMYKNADGRWLPTYVLIGDRPDFAFS